MGLSCLFCVLGGESSLRESGTGLPGAKSVRRHKLGMRKERAHTKFGMYEERAQKRGVRWEYKTGKC